MAALLWVLLPFVVLGSLQGCGSTPSENENLQEVAQDHAQSRSLMQSIVHPEHTGVFAAYEAISKQRHLQGALHRKSGFDKPSKALLAEVGSSTDQIIKKWVAQKAGTTEQPAGDNAGAEALASMPEKVVVPQIEQATQETVDPEDMSIKPHNDADNNEDFDPLMNANKQQRASGKLYRISKVQVEASTSRRSLPERTGGLRAQF